MDVESGAPGAYCALFTNTKHHFIYAEISYTLYISSVGIQSFMEEANLSKDCVLSAWRRSQFSRDDYVKLNTSPRAYT